MGIVRKSASEIEQMRRPNEIVAEVLLALSERVKPGVSTGDLDRFAEDFIRSKGAKPGFKGLYGFPSTLCTSVNEQVVHGIPGRRRLEEGDIISIDVGTYYNGFYGDAAVTLPVGGIGEEAKRLLRATRESLYLALDQAREGNRVGDIGYAVQRYVESLGYSVVRNFVGHGIGRNLHEEPKVGNYGPPGQGPKLKQGFVLAIEPMVNAGTFEVNVLADKWTAVTKDGKLSAHFEHTVAITENGPLVLTKRVDEIEINC